MERYFHSDDGENVYTCYNNSQGDLDMKGPITDLINLKQML